MAGHSGTSNSTERSESVTSARKDGDLEIKGAEIPSADEFTQVMLVRMAKAEGRDSKKTTRRRGARGEMVKEAGKVGAELREVLDRVEKEGGGGLGRF